MLIFGYSEALFTVLLIISNTVQYAFSQTITECCDLNLMDATRQVATETDRILPLGTFAALRVRLCTTDPVSVQIWTRTGTNQFQFKWQMQLSPTDQQTNEIYSIINLQNNPVTIEAGDRLALYNPSNGSNKIPVPYDRDTINGALYYSTSRYTGSQFTSGQQMTTEDLKFPRTFSQYLTFCTSVDNCALTASTTTTSAPRSTNPTPAAGVCCGPPSGQVSCDPSGSIGNNIDDQNDQIRSLEDDINRLLYILNNLINSTTVTGICPEGFISGVYGVGSCYVIHRDEKIQFAQAAIRCRDNYQAELLRIESTQEDEFVRNSVLQLQRTGTPGEESYWTAGVYNIPLRNWFWYFENARSKAPFVYRNWQNGMEPTPETIYDVCLVDTINVPNRVDYWQKYDCTLNSYYICEIPKKCL